MADIQTTDPMANMVVQQPTLPSTQNSMSPQQAQMLAKILMMSSNKGNAGPMGAMGGLSSGINSGLSTALAMQSMQKGQ